LGKPEVKAFPALQILPRRSRRGGTCCLPAVDASNTLPSNALNSFAADLARVLRIPHGNVA
jgi:hypothetical protein